MIDHPATGVLTIYDATTNSERYATQADIDQLMQYRLAFDGLCKNLRHIIANPRIDDRIEDALEVARRALERDVGDAPSPEQVEAEHLGRHPGIRNPDYVRTLEQVIADSK